ncbi:MAG TPA: ABC transporter ATP-binding protein [Thermoplasmata archaeon]|nr:ABC transporter ATP-binding protein [Thermoplasmata archaeon]
MADAIEVRKLTKVYGELTAVGGIDFTVRMGEVFAFLGPNGAGKTTTTEILEGLRSRTSGDVRVLGLDPWSEGRKLHPLIGVIPQEFKFVEKITPTEAIRYYGALFHTIPNPKELLDQVELADKANARFDTLSGGQKQKLGLALALVSDPKVCFLDEPTTGLDPQARRAIWSVIRALKAQGRTVFLTTHYLEEAELLSDHVAIINHGAIIAEGTAEAIIEKHGGPERLTIEAPSSLAEHLKRTVNLPVTTANGRVEVVMHDKGDALRVLSAVEASGIPWKGFGTKTDTLEDVFVHLVGKMDEGEVRAGATP